MNIHFRTERDGNCTEWRVYNVMRELIKRGHYVTDSTLLEELHPVGARGPGAIGKPNCPAIVDLDLIVYQRPTFEHHVREIVQIQGKFGTPIVQEIDDLFVKDAFPPDNPAWAIFHPKAMETKQVQYARLNNIDISNFRNDRMKFLNTAFKISDAMTTTTPKLGEEYSRFNSNVYVLPNCWDDSNPVWNLPNHQKPADRKEFTTIFFGGSFTHLNDMALLRGVLDQVLRRHPRVEFALAGDWRLMDMFPGIPAEQRRILGNKPFARYGEFLKQADIIIAPLRDNRFNQGKSDIRLMEAGIVETPWIASPMRNYKSWGVGGVFAKKPMEWINGLEDLIQHPGKRYELGLQGNSKAQRRAMSAQVELWERAYEKIIEDVVRRRPDSIFAQNRRIFTAHQIAAQERQAVAQIGA